MVTIFELLREQKAKIERLNSLREEVAKEKRLRDLDESKIWVSTDFKAEGMTNDKMRAAYVKKKMSMFPNEYAKKKNEFDSLSEEIRFISDVISCMKTFEVKEVDLELERE